ncbi:EthD family reductase [Micromonospora sp. A3M-1-15]|uniref:EthD family reductase n=1 Tax=Micromonospora sp. A3M-1-15 TaxID=2962035 RepID=UPI0020B86DE7|nr:EthD family reductase [Micromonospora sp. A3M-1-15]MCP3785438.1 EthD family reductase [Micromonospora sp. A3M-1-15]
MHQGPERLADSGGLPCSDSNGSTHKLLVLYPEPADPDHFRDYYVTNHLPLVARMPGLLAWRYSFDVAATQGETPYFAVFEAEFADAAAMTAARASPQGRQVTADVANYATGGVVVIHYPVQHGTA